MIMQSNVGFMDCLWDIVQGITRTFVDILVTKYVITHCRQNEGDVAYVWGLSVCFVLEYIVVDCKGYIVGWMQLWQ
jgi:hypothetical protein